MSTKLINAHVCKKCGKVFESDEETEFCLECKKYIKYNNKMLDMPITVTVNGKDEVCYVDKDDYNKALLHTINWDNEFKYLNDEIKNALKQSIK